MLGTVVFFAAVFFAAGVALALDARTFLGTGAEVLDLGVAFFADGGLGALLLAETVLVAFALVTALLLEAGLTADLEAGLF